MIAEPRCSYWRCTSPPAPGRRKCAQHLAYHAERSRAHRAIVLPERRDAGLCIACGQPAARGHVRCRHHLEIERARPPRDPAVRRAEYAARVSAGLCRIGGCDEAQAPGLYVCESHRAEEEQAASERRLEQRRKRSGPTQTDADRRAAGRVRVVVWLSAEEAEVLDALADGSTRRDAIGRLLRGRGR